MATCPIRQPPMRVPPPPYEDHSATSPRNLLLGGNTNTGFYLRELIIFYVDQVVHMRRRWATVHKAISSKIGTADNAARSVFWSNRAKLRKEVAAMKRLLNEIMWASRRINSLHRDHGSFMGHRNLQRRSEYMLNLCLSAICDMRCLEPMAVIGFPRHANVTMAPELQDEAGYASGLGDRDTNSAVATFEIRSPYVYDHKGISHPMELKVPLHFVVLMIHLMGKRMSATPDFWIQMLARYCMFLAQLIWNPSLYDSFYKSYWVNPKELLELPKNQEWTQYDLGEVHKELRTLKYHALNDPTRNKRTDKDVIQTRTIDWNNENYGVHQYDMLFKPVGNALWRNIIEMDRCYDVSYCMETMQSLFMRMIIRPISFDRGQEVDKVEYDSP